MSVYIAVELQEEIRHGFADCCAYYRTAESLIVSTFEFEHIKIIELDILHESN